MNRGSPGHRHRPLRILAFPRDPNPYQTLLHDALHRVGVTVGYLPWPTPSHTLNLTLLPLQLMLARVCRYRVVHLHWVYPFVLPALPPRVGRRLATLWFRLFLFLTRMLRLRLVWTAHNVVPHQPVFADDVTQRRRLAATADAVIVHTEAARTELAAIDVHPRRVALAPHGPYGSRYPDVPERGPARAELGLPAEAPVVLFFGRIAGYKGVTDLVRSWPSVRTELPDARLIVAGACPDAALRDQLAGLAGDQPAVRLRLESVPDKEIPVLFAAADLVCLPFRTVTTSGSAILAADFRRALLVPRLAALTQHLPDTTIYYPPGVDGLPAALVDALRRGRAELDRLGAAGASSVAAYTWEAAAQVHADLYRSLLAGSPARPAVRRLEASDAAPL